MPLPAGYVTGDGISIRGVNYRFSRIYHQSWVDPAAKDPDCFRTTVAGPNALTNTYRAVDGTLVGAYVSNRQAVNPTARNVIVTVTHATSIVACNGTIVGTDIYGREISDTWSVTATGTSKTSATVRAYKTVKEFTVTAAGDASANSVILGDGDILGLNVRLSVASAINEVAAGSLVRNGVFCCSGHWHC